MKFSTDKINLLYQMALARPKILLICLAALLMVFGWAADLPYLSGGAFFTSALVLMNTEIDDKLEADNE